MTPHVDRANGLFDVDLELNGGTFGCPGRDTTGDFVPSPDIDLTSIAATLAAGPGPVSGPQGSGPQVYYAGAARPGSFHKYSASRRKMRPHRNEHIKRTRISYDAFGGQVSKVPPSAFIFSATPAQQQPLATDSEATGAIDTDEGDEARDGQKVTSGYGFFGQLVEIIRVMLREMLSGNGSHV